jgi:hypothetical protein
VQTRDEEAAAVGHAVDAPISAPIWWCEPGNPID